MPAVALTIGELVPAVLMSPYNGDAEKMLAAEVLIELAREVRRDTLQILNAADPSWLTWTPPHTSNHILWHAGHALWLQDLMCVEPLSGKTELPTGWADHFGMNSQPSETKED